MTIKNCALCEDFKDKYWDWNLIQNPNIDFTTVSPQCKKLYSVSLKVTVKASNVQLRKDIADWRKWHETAPQNFVAPVNCKLVSSQRVCPLYSQCLQSTDFRREMPYKA